MKYIVILTTLLLLGVCALSAGCTSPTQAGLPPVTTVATPIPVSTSTILSTVVSTPVAVDTLPAEQYVNLELTKERPDYSLHLLYNGGKGEAFIQNILMKVTLADGTVVQQYMNDGTRRPRRGDELVIQGTRGTGTDRVEVFVTSAGTTYKVIDQPITIRTL
jgi:hypothetical protein